MQVSTLILDSSALIEGSLSKRLENKEIKLKKLIIPEFVIIELENLANDNIEKGFLGIDELKILREISLKQKFEISFFKSNNKIFNKEQSCSEIINIAFEEEAALMTTNKVQHLISEAKGIRTIYIHLEEGKNIPIEKYFDDETMSIHLKENTFPSSKKGKPGEWRFEIIKKKKLSRDDLRDLAKKLVEFAGLVKSGFIELERPGSTILQIENYRIVITKPPFSDGWEITAVRPVKRISLPEYNLSEKLSSRLEEQAEGILIAGAPGQGKSTFAQALAEFYLEKEKIVKTVEAPRDLVLPEEITQFAMSHGSSEEIHDILLLSRPDYTIYDEMRNTDDFLLFSDLRLSGVGMIGVIHATQAIDAIQRFIGRLELGVIPHVIDTVVFINAGTVEKIFALKMEVKVPSGMTEADLARPIVTVTDFETEKLEFEIYSYGEETVVVPVTKKNKTPLHSLAAESIKKEFSKYSKNISVDVSSNKAIVQVPESVKAKIIGKQGSNIDSIEQKLGISIDVKTKTDTTTSTKSVPFDMNISKGHIKFFTNLVNTAINIYVDNDFLMTAKISKKGQISIKRSNALAKVLINAEKKGKKIDLKL